MDAESFWKKVDEQLREQEMTISEMCELIGKSRNTVFSQRQNHVMPRIDQVKKMEEVLHCSLMSDEGQDPFMEYLPHLRRAEKWQLYSVRRILNMPMPISTKKDLSSLRRMEG